MTLAPDDFVSKKKEKLKIGLNFNRTLMCGSNSALTLLNFSGVIRAQTYIMLFRSSSIDSACVTYT